MLLNDGGLFVPDNFFLKEDHVTFVFNRYDIAPYSAGDFLLEPLKKKVAQYVFYKDLPYADIKIATLGNDAGIIGAAMLGK